MCCLLNPSLALMMIQQGMSLKVWNQGELTCQSSFRVQLGGCNVTVCLKLSLCKPQLGLCNCCQIASLQLLCFPQLGLHQAFTTPTNTISFPHSHPALCSFCSLATTAKLYFQHLFRFHGLPALLHTERGVSSPLISSGKCSSCVALGKMQSVFRSELANLY